MAEGDMSVQAVLRLGAIVVAFGCGLAQAQEDCVGLKGTDGAITRCMPVADGKSDKPPAAVTGSLPAGKTDRGGGQLLATDLIGRTVYMSDGSEAGSVVDIVIASSLDGVSLVIRTGGVLGAGGREVALPANRFAVGKSDSGMIRVVLAATPEQLQHAPVFDRTALMR